MKKLLVLMAVALAVVSCNKSEAVLVASQKQVNKQCPMVVDEMTTLKNVVYEAGDRFFIYNYVIDEAKCPMSLIKESLEMLAANVQATMEQPSTEALMDACINADVAIMYKYIGSESGEQCLINYYPKTKEVEINRN